ncbi:Asp23/Gls24 family envelope stress response protein [Lactobacillus sp. YT155]|uniref:Asp23/Gls24 family envelope stress response protein n=1 Tax=Lactobacillus sp. YT155 TaxID=3060955 RepID=UPI00265ED1ED|nr:Asp23/Gls24 family envelope stress response protein [Lactobacillus sp. YT155]MDO1605560.1 Asp23/Gls24 family envelope stress response protein [Lactobacillus sp. YT155]
MSDSKYISIQQKNNNVSGDVKVSPKVLETILGIAAKEVDGVYDMRDSLSSTLNSIFGMDNHGKGVTIKETDDGLVADIFVYFDYGVSVPKVSIKLQKAFKEQLSFMTDLKLTDVNVHVVGLIAKKANGKIEGIKISE